MRLCIDIDDTITYIPQLFRLLSQQLDAEIIIVSFRTDQEEAIRVLRELEVRWDQVLLSNDPTWGMREHQTLVEWKAWLVNQLEPDWFFEDMPEVVCRIRPNIKVLMPCDEIIRDWLGTATGA